MQKFKDALREEQKRLEEIIAKAKKENEHMPEGNLRISKHKNRCRYYHCVHDRNGIYIPKRNLILREQLAQKAYNSSIINIAEEQLAKINKMLEIDADEEMKKMYDSLHPDRKKLINPIEDKRCHTPSNIMVFHTYTKYSACKNNLPESSQILIVLFLHFQLKS